MQSILIQTTASIGIAPQRSPSFVWLPVVSMMGGSALILAGVIDATAIWILSMVLMGMPHGALDVFRIWDLTRKRAHPRALYFSVTVCYFVAAMLVGLCWLLAPVVALGGFLLLTIWHWGNAEAIWLEPERRWRKGIAVARGCWVVMLPIAADFEGARLILERMLLLSGSSAALPDPLRDLAAGIAVAGLTVDVALNWKKNRLRSLCEMGALVILALVLPAEAFFALFFVFVHSYRYLLMHLWNGGEARRAANRYGVALAVSIALMLPVWMALGQNPANETFGPSLIAGYLLLVSVLTLPHTVLVEILDG